jgi:hypothetical protein
LPMSISGIFLNVAIDMFDFPMSSFWLVSSSKVN